TEIGCGFSDCVYHIHAFDHFAESSVSAVQMRRSFVHDEELGTCGVRIHSPCHGQNAFRVSQVVGQETILSEFARNGVARAADSGTLRVAALDHKAADHAVEDQAVIESFLNEAYKIVD